VTCLINSCHTVHHDWERMLSAVARFNLTLDLSLTRTIKSFIEMIAYVRVGVNLILNKKGEKNDREA